MWKVREGARPKMKHRKITFKALVRFKMTYIERNGTQEDREETHLFKHEVRACTCECMCGIKHDLSVLI